MTISSRTPEGDPNSCALCGHDLHLEPSIDTRDAPCPHCGHLLWFSEKAKHRSDTRPINYEGAAMRLGEMRLGAIPAELQVSVIKAFSAVRASNDLQSEIDQIRMLLKVASWSEFVMALEKRRQPDVEKPSPVSQSLAKSAGVATMAAIKKWFAGKE